MKISNKDCNFYLKCLLIATFIGSLMEMTGCSNLDKFEGDVNCLDFATSYASINDSEVIFGLYLPNQSTYHAWVKRKDRMCMDQIRIFECDDTRYKEISTPSLSEINKLMGDRV